MEKTLMARPLLPQILESIISCPKKHVRWLNTLSYLENCGARKIAACEHPTLVPKQMLKHAAEEFRHAFFLKQQIQRLTSEPLDTYRRETLLGGHAALRYLDKLDVAVCRLLKDEYGLPSVQLKEAAYLLVTYAIEVRASQLYPAYQQMLTALHSKVSVRSIIAEEEHHLAEVEAALRHWPHGNEMAHQACELEARLFATWIESVYHFL